MKKTLKKTAALMLCALMLLGCVGAAFAADAGEPEADNGGYLVIGDSIARGCGSDGFYLDRNGAPLPEGDEGGQYDEFDMRNVQGAYTTQVAEAIGCNMPYYVTDPSGNFWPLCYPGMTTSVLMDLMGIEDGFDDYDLDYMNYDWMLAYFGSEEYSKDGLRSDDTKAAVIADSGKFGAVGMVAPIDELAKKASLITVEIGMCDVFYRAYRVASEGSMLADGINFDLSDPGGIIDLVKIAISQMRFGFEYWKTWYPVMIKKLIEWNPDAKIVLVGAFNLVNQLRITDSDAIPLGSIISAITDSMNELYKKWAKEFGDNVIYVDISNTEPLIAEKDWALLGDFIDHSFAGVHPSQYGHDYIARQILGALEPSDNGRNIVVDLGRLNKVDYVLVNGVKVSDYTLDGHVITVPCSHILARNLTVCVENADGTVAMQTYKLSYSFKDGYSAYRIYGTNDVVDTGNKNRLFYRLLKLIFEKIAGFFKNLFSGSKD
ncbi:MAG: hypothetical protein IJS90_01920 [Clostridia bacterium]|nr:hypothetical protein [Clostridia bacterium]